MHVHETQAAIEGSLRNHGVRPLARIKGFGMVNPALVAVHMTHLTESEIALTAEAGTHVVHCPQSNLKLASGNCPVGALLDAAAARLATDAGLTVIMDRCPAIEIRRLGLGGRS